MVKVCLSVCLFFFFRHFIHLLVLVLGMSGDLGTHAYLASTGPLSCVPIQTLGPHTCYLSFACGKLDLTQSSPCPGIFQEADGADVREPDLGCQLISVAGHGPPSVTRCLCVVERVLTPPSLCPPSTPP